jgi:hypothetical protein
VARDTDGAESQSAVQTFTTRPENYPPYAAWNPSPANNSTNQPVAPTLDWEAVDPDGDLLTFDVYLGTTDPPPLVANDVVESSYAAPALVFSTQYYWRVVTRDSHDAEAPGPLWRFTTRPENYAPTAPASPSPVHLATNVSLGPSLTWQCSDADGDAMTYDLYLGTTSPPPLYATNLPSNLAQPQWLIAQTLYYWRVVARDSKGALTSGPEWRFTTRFNSTPNAPASPLPAHNAAHQLLQLTLSWGCTDPDPGQALTYDVYFGMETSPPQVAGNLTNTSWITPALETGRFYHWKIVARDPFGATRSGPVWKFSTGDNLAPLFPSNPYPPDNGELDYATGVFLAWSSYDPEFQPVTFKVYVGTSINPPLAGEVTENEYFVGSFQPGAQYYWYVIASDGELTTTGPMWTFHIDPTATGAGDPTYELSLGQNHPNPFNPQTVIPYTVPTGPPLDVRLTIYDAAGHLIRVLVNETRNAGSYHVTWRGDNDQGVTVSSGVYYGVLRAGEKRLTRKLVLLK